MNNIYTVSQVNTYIKNMFTQDFYLQNVYIKGEVSNCTYHGSGHIYFTIKDEGGVMSCVMFKGNRFKGLKFQLEKGQKIVVLGSVNVYERDGKYQVYAREIMLEGAGLLYQKYEELKKELEEMGMFDASYKKKIPDYALKIGICTAKTGAAIQDIINISRRRNPYVRLYLYPSLVQGENAACDIVNGIRCLDMMGLDVIIVGRGGGSIEDLWAFNEEIVARAIFECNTPVISAVGHETDTTIADYVADLRAPTPSAAAELAVFDYFEFEDRIERYKMSLRKSVSGKIQLSRLRLESFKSRLGYVSPTYRLQSKKQYLCDMEDRMKVLLAGKLKDGKHRLAMLAERLKGRSPLEIILRGYGYVTDGSQKQIDSVSKIHENDEITITFRDGKAVASVVKVTEMNLPGVDYEQ